MLAQNLKKFGDDWYWITDGPVWDETTRTVKDGRFAVRRDEVRLIYADRGLGTKYVQFLRHVLPGLSGAKHIFQGLRRGLHSEENPDADKEKFVYTWSPTFDVEWIDGTARDRPAPKNAVFAVIASPNQHKEKFPEIDFFIESWTWWEEDSVLKQAPVGWVDRYDQRLWTRSD